MDLNGNIEELFKMFYNSTQSEDEELRFQADLQLQQILMTDHVLFLNCASVILNPPFANDVPLQAYNLTLIYMGKILGQNSNLRNLNQFRDFWASIDKSVQANIVSGLKYALICPDQTMWQNAAYVTSLLYLCEWGNYSFFQFLEEKIISECEMFAKYSALYTLQNIFQLPSQYPEVIFAQFDDNKRSCIINIRQHLLEILNECEKYDLNVIIEISKTFKYLIPFNDRVVCDCYDYTKLIEACGHAISMIGNLEYHQEFEAISRNIHSIFFEILKVNYHEHNEDKDFVDQKYQNYLDLIYSITSENVLNSNKILSSISIDFWNEFAHFEISILEEKSKIEAYNKVVCSYNVEKKYNITFRKYNYKHILADKISNLIPIIFEALKVEIEPNVEEDAIEPAFCAQSLIHSFLKLSPKIMIKCFFEELIQHIQADVGGIQAHLIMLGTVASIPYNPIIFQHLQNNVSFIFECLGQSDYRILNFALNALSEGIKSYNIINDDDTIDQLMQCLLVICKGDDETLYEVKNSALRVLASLIKSFTVMKRDLSDIGKINEIIDLFSECESVSLESYFLAKECLINVLAQTNTIKTSDSTIVLVKKILSEIYQSFINSQSYEFQQSSLYYIILIFKNFDTNLIEEGLEIANLLISMMDINSPQYENVLMALMEIVSSLKENSAHLITVLIDKINEALMSESPSIISNTLSLLGKLFLNYKEIISPHFNNILGIINSIFQNPNFPYEFFPAIGISLSNIVKSIGVDLDPNERNAIFEIFKEFPTQQYDIYDPNGYYFAHSLFETAFYGYSSIIVSAQNDIDFLINNRQILFQIVDQYLKFDNYENNVLMAYCDFMESAINHMKKIRRCRIIVCNKSPHVLLLRAESQQDRNLQKIAHDLFLELEK